MKITLLGTGTSQGIPVMGCTCKVCSSANTKDKRLRTSVLIETESAAVVIDCGPDFRQQMLRENVQTVNAVLLTHDHQDHVAGMDELRSYIFKNNCPMPIFAETRVLNRLKELYSYAFAETPYPGAPTFSLQTLVPGEFHVRGLDVKAIRLQHGNLPILGFVTGGFGYLTDVNFIPPESIVALQNLDILIIDALHHRKHHSHFNVDEALEVIKQLKPKKAFLTHISHAMGLHEVENEKLPKNVSLAFDGQQFTF